MPRAARVIAAAALVAALCAQQLVVASTSSADSVTVTDLAGLTAAFADGGTVVLGADISNYDYITGYQYVDTRVIVGDGTAVTLDLNGHNLDLYQAGDTYAAIAVPDTAGTSLTIEDSSGDASTGWAGSLTAGSGSGGAGIGGDHNTSGGDLTIAGGNITVNADSAAAIGSGSVDNAATDVDGGSLTVTGGYITVGGGGGYGGAGIGGGYCANGADYTQTGGYVSVSGGPYGAAGVGSGASWCGSTTSGGTVAVSGGTLTVDAGSDSAGIGGGYNGSAADVTVSGGAVNVTNRYNTNSVGIGNGNNYSGPAAGSLDVTGGNVAVSTYNGPGRAVGGIDGAPGIPVHVGPSGTLYLSSADSIGGGDGTAEHWGSLTNEGTLTLEYGTALTVPAGIVVHNSGRINLGGALSGDGTVDNTGVIVPQYSGYSYGGSVANDGQGPPGITVAHNDYRLSFDANGGPDTAPGSYSVYAPSLDSAGSGLPGMTAPTGTVFDGWWTAAQSGTKVTTGTELRTVAGDGPSTLPLHAHYIPTQQIAFSSTAPAPAGIGDTYPVTATGGGSDQPVQFSIAGATTNNACTLSDATVTFRHAGTCVIAADEAGVDAAYAPAPTAYQSIAVAQTGQTITFTPPPADVRVGAPTQFTVAATGGASGNGIVFSLDASTTGSSSKACLLTGTIVTIQHAGTCAIAAAQAGSTDYLAAARQVLSFGVGTGRQTITYTTSAPTAAQVNGTSYTPLATSNSHLAVTITVEPTTTNGACTMSAGVVSFPHRGTCVLAGTQAGTADWDAGRQLQSFTVAGLPQIVTYSTEGPTDAVVGGTPYVPAALGGATNKPVTFAVDPATTNAACSVLDGRVSFDHAGSCVLAASQAGDTEHAEGLALQTFAVGQAAQTVDFSSLGADATVGGSQSLHAIGGSSDQDVTFTVGDTTANGACTVDGTTVTYRHAGTCVLTAHQLGNADYLDAATVTRWTTVGRSAQAIAFTSDPPSGAVAGGAHYTVAAAGGASDQPVTFTVDDQTTNEACSVVGVTVSFDHAGACVIAAHKSGDTDYLDAPVVTQRVTVAAITVADLPGTAKVGTTEPLQAQGPAGTEFTFSAGSGTTNDSCTVIDMQVRYQHVGTCAVTAAQTGGPWTSTQTVSVGKGTQAITITSPVPTTATVGGTYTPAATSPVGAVSLSTSGTACSLSGSTVSFDRAGTCVVNFDQVGNADYEAAARLPQSFSVSAVDSTITVTTAPARTVYGQPAHASATVTVPGGPATGSVQFRVDGHPLGAPMTVNTGTAVSPTLTDAGGHSLSATEHTVTATFVPDGPGYASTIGTTTHVVDRAGTRAGVTVTPDRLTATVTPTAPGAGTPTGTVTLTVDGHPFGTATLHAGVATLGHAVPAGSTKRVAAVYAGDDAFTGSSASTSRRDPSVSARLTGTPARTQSGWYRGHVTVRFTCTATGAPLATACPKPVTLTREGAGQTVTRTVLATDGGADTVVVRGIDIDHTAPSVTLGGAHKGGVYRGTAPGIRCTGTDRLAGHASCTLTHRSTAIAAGRVVHYRVTATDRAGNRRTATGSYTVLTRYLAEAHYRAGTFEVQAGHTYTLVVTGSGKRPAYYNAEVAPRRPTNRGSSFHAAGNGRWTLGVSMDKAMRSHRSWSAGIKVGKSMHVLRLRVTNAR